MSDWQVGDQAMIVNTKEYTCEHGITWGGEDVPPLYSVHEVKMVMLDTTAAILEGFDAEDGCECLALLFGHDIECAGAMSIRCVKVDPYVADIEDRGIIEIMRGKKMDA